MSKTHCFSNKFQKSPIKRWWLLRPQRPITFNIGDLKLRDLAKLCFSNDYDEIELQKNQFMTSF